MKRLFILTGLFSLLILSYSLVEAYVDRESDDCLDYVYGCNGYPYDDKDSIVGDENSLDPAISYYANLNSDDIYEPNVYDDSSSIHSDLDISSDIVYNVSNIDSGLDRFFENFVSMELFRKQVDAIYDSVSDDIDDLEDSISDSTESSVADSVTTDLLTVNGNGTINGDFEITGTLSVGSLSVSSLNFSGAVTGPYFVATSTTDFNTFMGNVGIATTTPSEKLTVIGNTYLGGGLTLTGALKDSTNATGTLGMVLQTTGTSTQWVATSTLGISGVSTFLGLTDTPSSFTANRLMFTNSGATALTDSADLTFTTSTGLAIGSSTASARLDITALSTTTPLITLRDPIGGVGLEIRTGTSTLFNLAAGVSAGQSITTGSMNVGFGRQTLRDTTTGAQNSAFGHQALLFTTTGSNNAAFGTNALFNNATGSSNVAMGRRALYTNAGGGSNIAIGNSALYYNVSGSSNIAIGGSALEDSLGNNNTAVGDGSITNNTTGNSNTALGSYTLFNNVIGGSNVALGYSALYSNASSSANVAIGLNAGYDFNTTGNTYNTFLGYNTGRGLVTGDANTILGANVTGLSSTLSNNIIIADGDGNQRINVDSTGNVGIGTTTPSAKLTVSQSTDTATGGFWLANVDGSDFRSQFMSATTGILSFYGGDTAGTLNTATLNAAGEWTNASDISYKENIRVLTYGLDEVMLLEPRLYTIKNTDDERIGFIAQDMKKIIPEVVTGEDGSMGISYGNLVALAIKAIQELATKIDNFSQSFSSENISTEKLCIGNTCVSENELKELLQDSNNSSSNEDVVSVPQQEPVSLLESEPSIENIESEAGVNGGVVIIEEGIEENIDESTEVGVVNP